MAINARINARIKKQENAVNARFKKLKNKYHPSTAVLVIRNYRLDTSEKPKQDVLGYLGSIRDEEVNDQAARFRFWEKCDATLEKLKKSKDKDRKISDADREKLLKKIESKIPRPSVGFASKTPTKPIVAPKIAPSPVKAKVAKISNPRMEQVLRKYKERIG